MTKAPPNQAGPHSCTYFVFSEITCNAISDTSSVLNPAHSGGRVGAPVNFAVPGSYCARIAALHAAFPTTTREGDGTGVEPTPGS